VSFRVPSDRGERALEVVHTIVPLHDGAGKVDGVVVYTESLSERESQKAGAGTNREEK
jgi:hypothetical protein